MREGDVGDGSSARALARWGRAALPWLATLALLAALAVRLDAGALGQMLSGVRVGWLLLAAALGPLQIALSAERWRIAAGSVGHVIERPVALREFALSALLNQILPGGVPGDVLRAFRVRQPEAPLRAVRVVLFDRMLGLSIHLCVVLLGLCLWPLLHAEIPWPWPIALLSAALLALACALLALGGTFGAEMRRMLLGWEGLRQVALSLLLTASFHLGFFFCALAVGSPLGVMILTAVPSILLSMALPLTVGGWGIREWTASLMLAPLGLSAETAVACSALYGVSVWLGTLPGVLLLLAPRRIPVR